MIMIEPMRRKCWRALLAFSLFCAVAAAQSDDEDVEKNLRAAAMIHHLTRYEAEEVAIPSSIRGQYDNAVSAVRSGEYDYAEKLWGDMLSALPEAGSEEREELFHALMRECFGREVSGLRYAADKARYYQEAIALAERYIEELRGYKAKAGDGAVTVMTLELKRSYAYGESPQSTGSVRSMTAARIDAEIERFSEVIASLKAGAESAALELQFAARRQWARIGEIMTVYDRFEATLGTSGEQ